MKNNNPSQLTSELVKC